MNMVLITSLLVDSTLFMGQP